MGEHDDKGLYWKYIVLKQATVDDHDASITYKDFGDVDTRSVFYGKRKKTLCFVLSPEKRDRYGFASRAALLAYAEQIAEVNEKLSDDLIAWVVKIEGNIVDDDILGSYGVETPEGGTLTTDEVEIPPGAPRLKVEMDLSELEKAAKEEELLEELKLKLADERFARRVTEIQRDAALAGRDRLLREKLMVDGEEVAQFEKGVEATEDVEAHDLETLKLGHSPHHQHCGWCGKLLDDCECIKGKGD